MAILIVLWAVSVWYAYEAGRAQSSEDYTIAVSQHQAMQQEVERLRSTKNELQAQVSRLDRIAQVDRQAKVQLAKELKDFQDQQSELREELSFYRSIISPDEGKAGLRVYGLSITHARGPLHHFKLVLTQSGKSDSLAQGGVKMVLKGIMQGKEISLDLGKIRVADSPQLSYKFRYFQELTGSFRLPDEFVPREVTVKLIPRSGKISSKSVRTFDWQKSRL